MKALFFATLALASALATPALACSTAQRALITTYYWTVKPLCNTQPVVQCAVERQRDPQSPCRIAACQDYVVQCNAQSMQGRPAWMSALPNPG